MRISDWSSDVCSSDLERQRTAKLVRQSAEDGPVLASVARREYGLVATLHPAFQVHISPGLFGVGGTRQDYISRMRAFITMMSDEHFEALRSEEHTSELQSLMRISYAVFCLKKKNIPSLNNRTHYIHNSQLTH